MIPLETKCPLVITEDLLMKFIDDPKSELTRNDLRWAELECFSNPEIEIEVPGKTKIVKLANRLFKIIFEYSFKGEPEFNIDQENYQYYYKLIPQMLSRQNDGHLWRVITPFFLKTFNINITATSLYDRVFFHGLKITWNGYNAYMNPKPIYHPKLPTQETDDIGFLFNNPTYSDVIFVVENVEMNGHKEILKKFPYFQALLHWNDKNSKIEVKDFSLKVFNAMLHYAYKGCLPKDYFSNLKNAFDLYIIGDYYQIDVFKELSISEIYKRIDQTNVIEICLHQMLYKEPGIEILCQWFFRSFPNYGEIDLSKLDPIMLLDIYQMGSHYGLKELILNCLNELKNKVKLDDNFMLVCKKIQNNKDRYLKEVILTVIKENNLLEILKANRKTTYKAHWNLYKEIMTDLDLNFSKSE